jgi:23S rRNA pseudouridine955/2504/2580 synthase
MASVETRTVEADEAGMRLDRWFKAHFPALSFGHLQKLVRSGQVRVDGGRVKTSTRLDAGQAIRVPPLERSEVPAARAAREGRNPRKGLATRRFARPERAPAMPIFSARSSFMRMTRSSSSTSRRASPSRAARA